MKQITVYSFSELAEDIQDKVIDRLADINVDYDWWKFIYEVAKTVGLKITAFNINRMDIDIEFTNDATYTAWKITAGHGVEIDTYKLASLFKKDRDALVEKHSDGVHTDIVAEDNEDAFDNECDELESDFLQALGEEYLSLLRQQYEYLTSRECIAETIEANEYTFTKNGTQV